MIVCYIYIIFHHITSYYIILYQVYNFKGSRLGTVTPAATAGSTRASIVFSLYRHARSGNYFGIVLRAGKLMPPSSKKFTVCVRLGRTVGHEVDVVNNKQQHSSAVGAHDSTTPRLLSSEFILDSSRYASIASWEYCIDQPLCRVGAGALIGNNSKKGQGSERKDSKDMCVPVEGWIVDVARSETSTNSTEVSGSLVSKSFIPWRWLKVERFTLGDDCPPVFRSKCSNAKGRNNDSNSTINTTIGGDEFDNDYSDRSCYVNPWDVSFLM